MAFELRLTNSSFVNTRHRLGCINTVTASSDPTTCKSKFNNFGLVFDTKLILFKSRKRLDVRKLLRNVVVVHTKKSPWCSISNMFEFRGKVYGAATKTSWWIGCKTMLFFLLLRCYVLLFSRPCWLHYTRVLLAQLTCLRSIYQSLYKK